MSHVTKMIFACVLLVAAQPMRAQEREFDAQKYLIELDTKPIIEDALSVYADGMKFGVWYVEKESDDMDPTPIVAMVTVAEKLQSNDPSGRFAYFGFQFIGSSYVSIHTGADGRDYWPYCDFDIASISVDGAEARYIATLEDPGYCDKVALDGVTIRQMRAGSKAKIRLHGRDYIISLEGFTAALNEARKLAR